MVQPNQSSFGASLITELQNFIEDGDPIRTMVILFDAVSLSSAQMILSSHDLEHLSRINHLLAAIASAQKS